MLERYTERARRAIFFARFEASQSGSPAVEPEHILLGLLRENEDLLKKLTTLPDAANVLRKSVEHQVLPLGMIPSSLPLPLSTATKAVLIRAYEESEALVHKHIGPEHLLLGLFADSESLAAEALQASEITADRIRNLIGVGERE
jgi:ATP-dependent Clp protease ATP-binding subunit ClpC